jgi:hypothetical protein
VDVARQETTLMGLSGRKEQTNERRGERKGRAVNNSKEIRQLGEVHRDLPAYEDEQSFKRASQS